MRVGNFDGTCRISLLEVLIQKEREGSQHLLSSAVSRVEGWCEGYFDR